MTNANTTSTITVTPHIVCAGALDAIDFYKKAFGAEEVIRLLGPNGGLVHGCIQIGNGHVMLAEECPDYGIVGPKSLNGTPVTLHLKVPDVDAFIAQAERAGATVVMAPADMFWGDRYGQIVDPFGHRWSVATHIKDVTPEEMQKGMEECTGST